mmetsp:Transcript_13358/g.6522  ORF Transcript_13358/g.6522 Transcript_13358/m.6522 type:complete len:80 (-) Transcript_13358:25-264(-)
MNEERLWVAFKYFDVDNSGYITADNLKEAMRKAGKQITDEEVEDMISVVDVKENQVIDFEEFKNMMDPRGLVRNRSSQL